MKYPVLIVLAMPVLAVLMVAFIGAWVFDLIFLGAVDILRKLTIWAEGPV